MNATDLKEGVKEIWQWLRLIPFAYDQWFTPLKFFGIPLAGEIIKKKTTLGLV